MSSKRGVFISYCRSDGTNVAANLRKRLNQEHREIPLWQDIVSERGGRDWWIQITEALDSVEYMVLIMTPDAVKSETVRKEWRYARQKGVCIYPVKGSEALAFDTLPSWMRDKHFYNIEKQWNKFIIDLNARCETPRVPFMVDDLPENFVARRAEFEQLVAHLRDPKREEPVAITAALQGAGGYGKTTLARALCHDERIQEAFDDGILWVTLGQNPGDLTLKLVELIEVLSGERPGFKEEAAASARLRELLADRDILMVIDDVWNAAHLSPFLTGGRRCARLITTRILDTLPNKTQRVTVDAMQIDEAVNLLGAGLNTLQSERNVLRELAGKLGEWPVLLRLVNATLRERVEINHQAVSGALEYVNKALARRGLEAFNARNPVARDQTVDKTVGLSLELLNEREHKLYIQLAIFPEDIDIPLTTVEKLWSATGALDDFETEDLCARLYRLSLLVAFDLAKRHIRLHDVMKKYLNTQLCEPAALHGKLLDGWADFYHLPDGYAWRFVAYHLVQAGRIQQLRDLLLAFNWVRTKLLATDVYELIADYEFLADSDRDCNLIQGALRLSIYVLSKDKTQLPGQLIGRLFSPGAPSRTQTLVDQAIKWKECVWLRPTQRVLTSPGGLLMFNLEGHTSSVMTVAINERSDIVASGSADKTIKVWSLRIGNLLRTLKGHNGSIRGVAIAPDGSVIVSASEDKTLKVWDFSGNLLHTLEGHSDFVYAVMITPHNHIISGSADKSLRLWDLRTGKSIGILKGHANSVNAVAVTPDGNRAISSSLDRTLKIWDLRTLKEIKTLKQPNWVNGVAVWGTSHIILATHDGTLSMWDLETGQCTRRLQAHNNSIYGLAVTSDGKQAVSASADGSLRAWDLETGSLCRTFLGHARAVYSVAISPKGGQAVSAAADHKLKVWNLTGDVPTSNESHKDSVSWVTITANGIYAISTFYETPIVQVWHLQKAELLGNVIGVRTFSKEALAVTTDGNFIVGVLGGISEVGMWNIKTGALSKTFGKHENVAMVVIDSKDQIVVIASGAILEIWHLKTDILLWKLTGHRGPISKVVLTQDEKRIVSVSERDQTVRLWDIRTGTLVHVLENKLKAPVESANARASMSPDKIRAQHLYTLAKLKLGKNLDDASMLSTKQNKTLITRDGTYAVFAAGETLEIWHIETATLLHTLSGPFGDISDVVLERNSINCVLRNPNEIGRWNLENGEQVSRINNRFDNVNAVALASSGTHAVYASRSGRLKLYKTQNGIQVAAFTADSALNCCAITSDGLTVVAGDSLGNLHFLRLEGLS